MSTNWKHLPADLKYLQPWAAKFGVRGLTIYNKAVPLAKYTKKSELAELREAYETIANKDVDAIIAWCHSVETGSAANDAREEVRGLLLLFDRLAAYELAPFTEGRVRYRYPEEEPRVFDWTRLPAQFHYLIPWLKKFEHLRSELAVYNYAGDANAEQRRELVEFKKLLDRDNGAFADWCIATERVDHPAEWEIFQAGWMFLLVDFSGWEQNPDGTLKYPG
jgi:hypothetical protein